MAIRPKSVKTNYRVCESPNMNVIRKIKNRNTRLFLIRFTMNQLFHAMPKHPESNPVIVFRKQIQALAKNILKGKSFVNGYLSELNGCELNEGDTRELMIALYSGFSSISGTDYNFMELVSIFDEMSITMGEE